jgi:hypothetical protein
MGKNSIIDITYLAPFFKIDFRPFYLEISNHFFLSLGNFEKVTFLLF